MKKLFMTYKLIAKRDLFFCGDQVPVNVGGQKIVWFDKNGLQLGDRVRIAAGSIIEGLRGAINIGSHTTFHVDFDLDFDPATIDQVNWTVEVAPLLAQDADALLKVIGG